MTKLKLIAALALGAALLLGLAKIKMLSAENDRLESRLAESEHIRQSLTTEISAGRAALSAREAERKRLANESLALQEKLQELYRNDPNAQVWSDTLCPDNVLDCLRP